MVIERMAVLQRRPRVDRRIPARWRNRTLLPLHIEPFVNIAAR
jgi:hypothetical protein